MERFPTAGRLATAAPAAGLLCLAALFAACETPAPPERREEPVEAEQAELPPESGGVVALREGFSTPESAVYDPEQDVYFVSNVNGGATARDDNGYIVRIDAATGTVEPRWIDGSAVDVTLHGPRGLSLQGDELWAVDIDSVRRFDRRTGAQLGVVAIPGSIFLNDAFAAADGSVYVSDSALPGGAEDDRPAPRDAVFRVTPDGRVEELASGQDLHRPDGLWLRDGELWVTAFGSNQVYRLEDGGKADVQTLPQGVLDGLMWLDDGTLLVSSWDAGGIYRGSPGGPYELIVSGIESPADFGLDTRRDLLVVPHFREDVVTLHPLAGAGAP